MIRGLSDGRLNRREALALLGWSAAGVVCLAGARSAAPATRRLDLEELSERLRITPRARIFDMAAEAIRRGADQKTMLGAIFLCGVREIRPRPSGILHAVMMVESSFQLSESVSPRESWLPILWNLDDLKSAQDDDRVEAGDWALAAPRGRRGTTADSALREFHAAMEAWDAERSDRALVDLLPYHDHASFFEIVWPLACRCSAFIGHKMIHTAQVERVVRRIGWSHAEPALRALVMTILVSRETEAFERARHLARRLPAGWLHGREDPEQSAVLLGELRARDSQNAQELIVDALGDGVGPLTIWDALRLLGSEIFLRRPGRRGADGRPALLPVHALTVTGAFGHAWRAAKSDETKRLLILQAAAWLTTVRDAVVEIVDLSMKGPGIETLGANVGEESPGLRELLERASPDHLRPFLDREPAQSSAYLAHVTRALFRKAQEHHQIKYAAAMQEESRLAHRRWASRIMAPAVDYVANPEDGETEVYLRSVRALEKAGVG